MQRILDWDLAELHSLIVASRGALSRAAAPTPEERRLVALSPASGARPVAAYAQQAMTAAHLNDSRGADAEARAREIAALLGVPDFIYLPLLERKGATQREISDGMLICGEDGLIMQVKTREAPEQDTPARAERWIHKNAEAARRQAEGTRRRLSQSRAVTFTSLRGYTRTLSAVDRWPAVVVIDHPLAPASVQLPHSEETLWITIEDWRELHARLRSTATVIAYVRRALESRLHPPLGGEADRYLALAQADAAAYGGPSSVPMLPLDLLEPEDALYAALIDDLIEKVWPQDGPIAWREPDEYRAIVERLDRIPPAMRARLGRKIIATLKQAIANGKRRSFLLYDTSQEARILFVCDVLGDREPEDRLLGEIMLLASVRQHQALESGADPNGVTLAIGIFHAGKRAAIFLRVDRLTAAARARELAGTDRARLRDSARTHHRTGLAARTSSAY